MVTFDAEVVDAAGGGPVLDAACNAFCVRILAINSLRACVCVGIGAVLVLDTFKAVRKFH